MIEAGKAVFLSYASQDADAAKKICEALRAAGVEVWFDQSELVGGDAWDQKIRKHIKECTLLIPVISAATQARTEGYFRLEWRLADQRTHLMAKGRPFILPVVIDDTRDADAHVPDSFTEVQWTRLKDGETLPAFVARVKKLLSAEQEAGSREMGAERLRPAMTNSDEPATLQKRRPWLVPVVVAALVFAALAIWPLWRKPSPPAGPPPMVGTEAAKLADQAQRHYQGIFTRADLALAEELGRRATELEPTLARAWAVRAAAQSCYLMRGYVAGESAQQRAREAQTYADRALALDRDEPEALIALGQLTMFQNAPAQAEAFYRRVLTRQPDNPFARRYLSIVLRTSGRVPEAIAVMEDAVRRNPGDALTHFDLAIAYAFGWDWPKAWGEADAALALRPFPGPQMLKVRLAFQWKGDVSLMRQLVDQVDVTYRGEDDAVLWAMRCGLYERRPDRILEAAGQTTRNYLEESFIFPGPKAWFTAEAYQLEGKDGLARQEWQAAESVLRERLQTDSRNLELRLKLAVTLAWLQRGKEAREELTAIESAWREQLNPDRAWDLASYYAAAGDAKAAVPLLRMALYAGTGIAPLTVEHLQFDPWWDKIRGSPEFQALLANPPPQPGPVNSAVRGAASHETAIIDQTTVAVLAFENLSDDKGNEYFSDGISEELLTVLQKIPGLHVAARTSSFSFKGKAATDQEIGEKLGVAHIVEGSVQKSGTRVKVTAHLSRAATGEEIWSESYTRELKDVFALQEELALAIVGELRGHLAGSGDAAAVKAAIRGGTSNPEAYQLYLQGQFHAHRFSEKNMNEALAAYQRAIDLDPNFALAWAGLGAAHAWITGFSTELDQAGFKAHLALARQSAQRALAIAPKLPEGLFALALIQLNADFDFKAAGETIRTGLALAPADPALLTVAGNLANAMGDMARADDFYHQAAALDPVNPTARSFLAFNLVMMGKHAEAAAEYARVVELNPAAPWAHAGLGLSLVLQGKFEEGVTEAQGDGAEWARLLITALGRFAQKRLPEADAALAALTAKSGDTAAYQIAEVHAFRGEKDLAFSWLERALRQRDSGLLDLQHDPLLANLEGDPRWPVFLAKMGMAASP